MATRKPEATFRMGRIQAAVWKNNKDKQVFYNVTIQRSYRDGDTWKHATTFGRNDLPLVVKVADQAHSWIYEQGSSDQDSTADVPTEGDDGGTVTEGEEQARMAALYGEQQARLACSECGEEPFRG